MTEVSIEKKVAFLELFFDLVFVFAITQLVASLVKHQTLADWSRTMLVAALYLASLPDRRWNPVLRRRCRGDRPSSRRAPRALRTVGSGPGVRPLPRRIRRRSSPCYGTAPRRALSRRFGDCFGCHGARGLDGRRRCSRRLCRDHDHRSRNRAISVRARGG